MTGQNESIPDRVAGIPAGIDYMAQSSAREKMGDNYVPTPMIEHTNCDYGNYPKVPAPKPSYSTEMPDFVREATAYFSESGMQRVREATGNDADGNIIRWLASDRERLIIRVNQVELERDAFAEERHELRAEVERLIRERDAWKEFAMHAGDCADCFDLCSELCSVGAPLYHATRSRISTEKI